MFFFVRLEIDALSCPTVGAEQGWEQFGSVMCVNSNLDLSSYDNMIRRRSTFAVFSFFLLLSLLVFVCLFLCVCLYVALSHNSLSQL